MDVHHSFNTALAAKYKSVEIAILIHHFCYHIDYNRRTEKNFFDGRTWYYDTIRAIAAHFEYMNVRKVEKLLNKMVKLGILIKGNYNATAYDRTTWYAFKDESLWHFPKKGNGNTQKGTTIPDPIPDPSSAKAEVNAPLPPKAPSEALEKALPPSLEGKKEAKPPKQKTTPKRKYPRKKENQEAFEFLKSLNLNTDEDTLSVWSHKYSFDKIKNAWAHLQYKIYKGYKPKNMGAVYRRILEREATPISELFLKNLAYSQDFKKKNNWEKLSIHDRFCCDERCPEYDISFAYAPSEFQRLLHNLWKKVT